MSTLARRKWVCITLAVAASIGALTRTSLAQSAPAVDESGTIYFGGRPQQEELPKFFLDTPKGSLDLQATYAKADSSNDNGGDVSTKEMHFEETLTLYTEGYIVHPNLVDLRLSVTGGLTQDHFEDNLGSGSSSGILYGWDISAILFRNQPSSVTLFTRRTESTYDVPFGPTQRTTSTATGATWLYRSADGYAQIDAFHAVDSRSSFAENDHGETQTRDALQGQGDQRLTPNQVLTWSFLLQNTNDDFGTGTDHQQSVAGSLGHTLEFGDNKQNSLGSGVSYDKTTGDFPTEHFRWSEHMHLQHTQNFDTNYDYNFDRTTYGSATTDTQQAYADARYRLYESLTNYGRLGWRDVSSGGTSTKTYNADLSSNYQKIVPYGLFLLNGRLGYELQDLGGSDDIATVNQPIAFTALDPIKINQPNAIPSTVLIRDAVTGRIYEKDTDYTVRSTPVGLEINRVIGGNITPAQPLLLDYTYTPLDANEITTTTFGLGTQYQINKGPLAGLTPFANFSGQNQNVSGGNTEAVQSRDYVVGTDYQRGDLTLSVRREWYDSTVYPFDAWRYEARLDHRFPSDITLSGSALYSDIQYSDPDQRTQDWSLNLRVTQQVTQHITVTLYGAYVDVQSDPGGQTQGLEEGLEANWYYRQTRVYLKIRNSTLDTDITSQTFQFVQLGLSRSF